MTVGRRLWWPRMAGLQPLSTRAFGPRLRRLTALTALATRPLIATKRPTARCGQSVCKCHAEKSRSANFARILTAVHSRDSVSCEWSCRASWPHHPMCFLLVWCMSSRAWLLTGAGSMNASKACPARSRSLPRAPELAQQRASLKRRLQYAAVPYRQRDDGTIEVMLVTSRETRRWIIPKGWPIGGAKPHASAAREAL